VVRRHWVYLQASRVSAQLTLWLLVAALFLANSVEARVGDSRSEIETRYGDSFAKSRDDLGNEQRSYPFRDFIVVVSFEKGKSVCETFLKSGKVGSGFQVQMSEIRAIMDANERKNVTWVPKLDGISWETSDKKLQAINLFGRLQIATKNYAERMRVVHTKQDLHHSGGR
jgi:hypothetical protein